MELYERESPINECEGKVFIQFNFLFLKMFFFLVTI